MGDWGRREGRGEDVRARVSVRITVNTCASSNATRRATNAFCVINCLFILVVSLYSLSPYTHSLLIPMLHPLHSARIPSYSQRPRSGYYLRTRRVLILHTSPLPPLFVQGPKEGVHGDVVDGGGGGIVFREGGVEVEGLAVRAGGEGGGGGDAGDGNAKGDGCHGGGRHGGGLGDAEALEAVEG